MSRTGYLKRLYNPAIFQGDLSREGYFEGWYFKHVSHDASEVMSFIPGVSLADEKMAFVQFIDGKRGKTTFYKYPIGEFSADPERFELRVGPNRFSERGIELDLEGEGAPIKGRFEYGHFTRYPRSLLAPGIMGWYSYIPVMECYHGVVSVTHAARGAVSVNGKNYDFGEGRGYIEKDWGVSFPERWIWMQANSFSGSDASVMLSVAKIPWRGRFFSGFLCFLYAGGEFYRFMTYNRSRIEALRVDGGILRACLANARYAISIEVKAEGHGKLLAPKTGRMERIIKESIDATASVELRDRAGTLVFRGESPRAGFEDVGDMAGLWEAEGGR
ncbi:MAG: hypothetical protein EPN93_12680 [Spirochaetes bacterium]|nr:MAG: hypothetical protein EPN93_12680 [Spirochaetota bacterium]